MNMHWKDWSWSWNSNTLATWCEELTHWKRPWCWERLKAGGERDDRGWDCWMTSPTWWTWVWVNSGSWWWTGKPGVLQSIELQNWTRLNDWNELNSLSSDVVFNLKNILHSWTQGLIKSAFSQLTYNIIYATHTWWYITEFFTIFKYESLIRFYPSWWKFY